MTALTVAILFLLSIFLLPLLSFIPQAAASSALIYVGILMMSNIKDVDFSNAKNATPAFISIIIMLLSYSITNGIGMGIITFAIIDSVIYIIDLIKYNEGKIKNKPKLETTFITFIIVVLFLIYFLVPTVF